MAAIGLVVGLLAVALPIGPISMSSAQDAPPIAVLPVPDEADAVTSAVSPVVWQACRSVGLAVGLVAVAGTLAGVPPDVTVPLNEALATSGGPVLALFFELCQEIPLPDEPPLCAVDEQVPPLPSLGRPVLLAGLLANELRALDATISGLGAPLDGALGAAADDLLACVDGQQPAPDDLPAESEAGDPPGREDGLLFPVAPPVRRPTATTEPLDGGRVTPAGSAIASGPVPVATASTVDATDGAGLALSLLGVAAIALLAWVHVGNPRSRSRRGATT
jgi:hypothetical protein